MNKNSAKAIILVAGLASSIAIGGAHAGGPVDLEFDPSDFLATSAHIDNRYWPQAEGRTFVYRSVSKDGCEVNEVQVTYETPVIAGITTRQILDQVWEDDDCDGGRDFLTEYTLDWYAQDRLGNVWYFGEATEAFCDRSQPELVCSTEGSWKTGEDGARPGIVMLAHPTAGASYQQEFAEDAADMAKVVRTNAVVHLIFDNDIDPDDYQGCLKIKEWSPLEHGAIEYKYYCRDAGLLVIDELQGGTVRTELVDVLGP